MKTLKNHQILFDAECPICQTFTHAFVESGMLNSDGRTSYQELSPQACPMLDMSRAVNEIALVNQETGEVTYGIESLFKLLAVSFPILQPLFTFQPFVWLMSKLYAFIAFNRRVIFPAAHSTNSYKLQPTFRLGYRLAYLGFTWILTSITLSAYAPLLSGLVPVGSAYREYLICGGQILFQGVIIGMIDGKKRWDYLGNMMSISFVGSLLLLPVLLLAQWLNIHPILYAAWFIAVAGLMLMEHTRRCRLLALSWKLTASWVLYRVIVLWLIFLFA